MKKFSFNELFELRKAIPVEILIQSILQVPSKTSEGVFRFLCPICNEFQAGINPNVNLVKCFRCERNFNTIDLVMENQGCGFRGGECFVFKTVTWETKQGLLLSKGAMMLEDRLKYLETIIAKNQYRFYEIGQALLEIRDSRLYKQALFTSFEAYARSRWDIGRSQVYRLIEAYSVINNLSQIGDRLPGNEAQARPLVPLSPPEQRQIWKEFLDTNVEVT